MPRRGDGGIVGFMDGFYFNHCAVGDFKNLFCFNLNMFVFVFVCKLFSHNNTVLKSVQCKNDIRCVLTVHSHKCILG